MEISIEWFNDQFNVGLASKEGAEPFLSVKGCRIVEGSKGPFVSYPATKNQNTGKYWNHVWASDKFNAAVLAKAQASKPAGNSSQRGRRDVDEDVPF